MAAISSMTFDKSAYNAGDTVTLTVAYTADVPGVSNATATATATVTDASGNVTAAQPADFTVSSQVPAGDVVAVADTGSHAWTKVSDDGATAVFTATA